MTMLLLGNDIPLFDASTRRRRLSIRIGQANADVSVMIPHASCRRSSRQLAHSKYEIPKDENSNVVNERFFIEREKVIETFRLDLIKVESDDDNHDVDK